MKYHSTPGRLEYLHVTTWISPDIRLYRKKIVSIYKIVHNRQIFRYRKKLVVANDCKESGN